MNFKIDVCEIETNPVKITQLLMNVVTNYHKYEIVNNYYPSVLPCTILAAFYYDQDVTDKLTSYLVKNEGQLKREFP